MKGPKSNAKLARSFDWMEYGIIVAGLLVVAGLVMESGPELRMAWIEWRLPKLSVTGGVIVTIGVFIEVVLGIFITQRANREQSDANERIEQVKLERAKLEARFTRRTIARKLTDEEVANFVKEMAEFAGQTFLIQSHIEQLDGTWPTGDKSSEQIAFTIQLGEALKDAGWVLVANTSLVDLLVRQGVTVFLPRNPSMHAADSSYKTALAGGSLVSRLRRLDISVQGNAGGGPESHAVIIAVGLLS